MQHHRAPRWLVGGNLQTIWPAVVASRLQGPPPRFVRERWSTPDGDFVDVDRAAAAAQTAPDETPLLVPPLLVLFHGLEGSSASHYAQAFARAAQRRGWAFAVPHFRGCSGTINLAPRAYHSGDFEEIGWMLGRLRAAHRGPLLAVGVSLGGNALLRWAEEAGEAAGATVNALAAISAPLDLAAGGRSIGSGFNRLVYTRMFLRSMKPKAFAKLAQHPGLFDRQRMLAARTLFEFDDIFTAPLHGFRDANDYYARGSARPHLRRIRVPALVLNARNDPFVPAASLPRAHEVGPFVTLWQPRHGGHAGFVEGRFGARLATLPEQIIAWLQERL